MDLYCKYKSKMQLTAEKTYIFRALQMDNMSHMRIPQLYGTVKVHKIFYHDVVVDLFKYFCLKKLF